jgi:hypothetical protein
MCADTEIVAANQHDGPRPTIGRLGDQLFSAAARLRATSAGHYDVNICRLSTATQSTDVLVDGQNRETCLATLRIWRQTANAT